MTGCPRAGDQKTTGTDSDDEDEIDINEDARIRCIRNSRRRLPEPKRRRSRDNRLTKFFYSNARYSWKYSPQDDSDSDVEFGLKDQFADARKNTAYFPVRHSEALWSKSRVENAPGVPQPWTEHDITATATRSPSPYFRFPDSSSASSSSDGSFSTAKKKRGPRISLAAEESGQFDDSETDRTIKNVKKEKRIFQQPSSPINVMDHRYYLVLRKLFGEFVQSTPLIPYPNLGSLNVTADDHLFFTSNRLCYSGPWKGFFWCLRNPLEGIRGCRIGNRNGLMSWKLNSPTLDTRGPDIAVGMYDSPITTAKPMANKLVFFGDESGKVGVAWYYFRDEVDKLSYKLEPCRIEMARLLEVGLFDVVETDKKWLTNHNSRITAVDVSPRDCRTVVSGARNGSVFTWDANVLHVKNRFPRAASIYGEVTSISFAPNSSDCFATAAKEGPVMLWDVRCVTPFKVTCTMKKRYVASMEWLNGNYVLAGSSTGEVMIFDIRNASKYLMERSHFSGKVSQLAVHPSKPYFAASAGSHINHFVGLTRFKIKHRGEMQNLVSGIAFFKDYVLSVDHGCHLTAIKYA